MLQAACQINSYLYTDGFQETNRPFERSASAVARNWAAYREENRSVACRRTANISQDTRQPYERHRHLTARWQAAPLPNSHLFSFRHTSQVAPALQQRETASQLPERGRTKRTAQGCPRFAQVQQNYRKALLRLVASRPLYPRTKMPRQSERGEWAGYNQAYGAESLRSAERGRL